jgi:SecD/SecF fusion protein
VALVGGEPLKNFRTICCIGAGCLLAGCGGGGDHMAAGCGDAHPPHALVYRVAARPGAPVTPQRIERTAQLLCERGAGKASVHRVGATEIEIGSQQRPGGPDPRSLAASHTFAFYDWEPNLLPPDQAQPTLSIFTAVETASRQHPRAETTDVPPGGRARRAAFYDRRNDTAGDKYYLFGPGRGVGRTLIPPRQVASRANPIDSNQATQYFATRSAALRRAPAGSLVVKVPRGVVVLKDEQRPNSGSLGYWVLEDDAELSAGDITHPTQTFDPQTNEPIVTFGFTARGRAAFARITRREARRGEQILRPPGTDIQSTFQTFAIALDNRLVSRATVNYQQNPDGISGGTGAQINGLGNIQQTQDLALSLGHPRLPLNLVLARVR